MEQPVNIIGVAYGNGAGNSDCRLGPDVIAESRLFASLNLDYHWRSMHRCDDEQRQLAALPTISQLNQALAQDVYDCCERNKPFLVIGGDQSCSLGTWSGACSAHEDLGLIWIDAHMDAHTPETTASGNIHGMPLAALLGYGDRQMTECFRPKTKFSAQQVILIGIRSYEDEELALLEKLGVRIYFMPEIEEKGIHTVLHEAKEKICQANEKFAISIDLDGIDPRFTPGVGTPVSQGIDGEAFLAALKQFSDERFIGAEIVEFNPRKDHDHLTEAYLVALIGALFHKESA